MGQDLGSRVEGGVLWGSRGMWVGGGREQCTEKGVGLKGLCHFKLVLKPFLNYLSVPPKESFEKL